MPLKSESLDFVGLVKGAGGGVRTLLPGVISLTNLLFPNLFKSNSRNIVY
jgi:hypothetical protein